MPTFTFHILLLTEVTVANQAIAVPLGKQVPSRGLLRAVREELAENQMAYWLLVPSVLGFLIFLIFPIMNMIATAFSAVDIMGRATQFGTLKNFGDLFRDERLPMIIRQTIIFAFGTVLLEVIISFPLALILNTHFPGRALAKALILIPWAMPYAVSAITWKWIFHGQMGSLNYFLSQIGIIKEYVVWLGNPVSAFSAAMFVEVWSSVAFMTVTFLAGLQGIPPHIYDAAKMDGASSWREFRDMTLPQMKTIFMIVTLLSIIWAFRSFAVIWILTKGDPIFRTDIAVTYLYKLAFEFRYFGQGFALAVCIFVVLIIFSIIYTRLLGAQEGG
jgi:multiple sugar transport system permease protein